ncbi:HAD superfamily hydrolase (TIGR01509 family) [Inquilinus ginsengisoli]|uniref:HAD family hydrolase n=1 Tax=Inquilinus ginsengisoli TaxID=363840 RepID=UPI003D204FF6
MTRPKSERRPSWPRLVLFDCDGVLVDSERLIASAEAEALAAAGFEASPRDLLDRFTGIPAADMFRTIVTEQGRPLPAGFGAAVDRRIADAYRRRLEPIPDAEETLRRLDVPCCVASSSSLDRLRLALFVTGLDWLLMGRIFSTEMVARGKPAPDLFLHAADRMGAAPAHCLVVEDSVAGVTAARAAGMTAFGFTGGSHGTPDLGEGLLAAGADLVFSRMAALPQLIHGAELDRTSRLAAGPGRGSPASTGGRA